MWGISYPGFYVSAGMIDAHPALKAASPQAPVTDYYLGDDSFHNGAFMLAANFGSIPASSRAPRPPGRSPRVPFDYGTPSGYEFYLGMGPLRSGAERYGVLSNPYYRLNLEHTSYDAFWKARSIWKHFKGITPAVLTVGGWFDAEDLAGPLLTYRRCAATAPDAQPPRDGAVDPRRLVARRRPHGGQPRLRAGDSRPGTANTSSSGSS
jgi:uncharacterized protein